MLISSAINANEKMSTLACRLLLTVTVWSICGYGYLHAQVAGLVKDGKTGKPLVGVEVFVNNSTLLSTTDEEGNFDLGLLNAGFVNLVLIKDGYEVYQSTMRVQPERAYSVTLSLNRESRRSEPIKKVAVNNTQTGYRTISYFRKSPDENNIVRYQALPSTGLNQSISWENWRKELYMGSFRHWLSALVSGKTIEEGFEIRQNGITISPDSIFGATKLTGYYRITLTEPIEVSYKGDRSKLVAADVIDVSEKGTLLNPKLLIVEGAMQRTGIPSDYEPIEGDVEEVFTQEIKQYYEKVYLHTDKPYYYQGEAIWFKAYLNYYYPAWRDSLSRVLYVEVISPKKKIVLEKMFKIENGFAHGDFILPDTIKRGDYYLRAYTNLQRNFGIESLYIRHVPILGITDKVDPITASWEPMLSEMVTIHADKASYHTREKITIALQVKDKMGDPITSNLSISVTDASQVLPVRTSTIEDSYPLSQSDIIAPEILRYKVERGVGVKAQYYNDKGKPVKTLLKLVQWKSDNAGLVETDDDGVFELGGLEFYDSARFFYSTENTKKERGRIHVNKRDIPSFENVRDITMPLALIDTETAQRIVSEYEVPKETRVLSNVDIVAARMNTTRQERPYGVARGVNVVTEKDINPAYGDLNYSLVGKIPGLLVQQVEGGWNVKITRIAGLTASLSGEPLVTINDVPMAGNAGSILSMIDPATVRSIEVSKAINVLYGSQGSYGVISVYTKTGEEMAQINPVSTLPSFTFQGYSTVRKHTVPDHSKSDNTNVDLRSGIYWNENFHMQAESRQLSFYSADLQTTYRVVVEGVTEKNEPVHAEYFIKIEN